MWVSMSQINFWSDFLHSSVGILPHGGFAPDDRATFCRGQFEPTVWGANGLGIITLATLDGGLTTLAKLAPGDAKYRATEATLSRSAATTRIVCISELHNRRYSECSALNNLRTVNVEEVSANRYLSPHVRYWRKFFFFLNPFLFASCTCTFSKWWNTKKGVKRSAQ
jgi:hypothetical protein